MSDYATMRDVAIAIAGELAETVDGEWGCCHGANEMMLGYAVLFDGDRQEVGDDCSGKLALDRWLAIIDGIDGGSSCL